jgi:nitronate monooxygenase
LTGSSQQDRLLHTGIEAGGHGGSEAPPLLTLLQAVLDALPADRALVVATGGVSTGQQVAALLTLGADGVALGTRLLFTEECVYTDAMKEAIVRAGHNDTIRTLAYDEVGRTNYWPPKHDGRALRNKIIDDLDAGISLEERLKRFDESAAAGDNSRLVVWAGAGVGLTKKISPAAVSVPLGSSCHETQAFISGCCPGASHGSLEGPCHGATFKSLRKPYGRQCF